MKCITIQLNKYNAEAPLKQLSFILAITISLGFLFTGNRSVNSNPEKIKEYSLIADSLRRYILTNKEGYQWLKEVCEIGPRLSGSALSLKAIKWAENKMKQLGFDSVWLEPVMVPHWERGDIETMKIVEGGKYKNRQLAIAALGGSVSTNGTKGIIAEVIRITSFQDLSEKKELVKGKIVFYDIPFDESLEQPFAGYGKNVRYRVNGSIEAARYGAVATILRSITTRNDNTPHVGVMYYNDSIPKIPGVAIGIQDADLLAGLLNDGKKVKLQLQLNCRTLPDALSYNVIGEIRGSLYPDQIVMSSGHFDSWDKGDGAHDDAAGCVQAMEAVYAFKKLNLKPLRTQRVVFYINEENGSRGAIEYAANSAKSHRKHICAIEADRGASVPIGFYVESDSTRLIELQSWLPVLKKVNIHFVDAGGSGADVSKLKGVPLLMGFATDPQRYFDFHHSANDVVDAVNPREFSLGSAAIATMMYIIDREGVK